MTLKYGSVCSGIEAASLAWQGLDWQPQFFSEIEPFCCRLLQHRFSSVPNFGDLTKFKDWSDDVKLDLLVGGTPCQAFSVAGLRQGLADPRGNLALVFLGVLDKYRPRWVVWENVPGVLSSSSGRDFGAFLGALAELGYGFAYRVLDAQHFGVPQRRRRVFVVGHLGDWRRAAAVLFERPCVSGNSSTGKSKRKSVAALTRTGVGVGGADDNQAQAGHLIDSSQQEGICFQSKYSASASHPSFDSISPTVDRQKACGLAFVQGNRAVRRLTPIECERLQGMPGDWTLISGAKDSPRYRAIGNSMAVPCMRWIGAGIAAVEALS